MSGITEFIPQSIIFSSSKVIGQTHLIKYWILATARCLKPMEMVRSCFLLWIVLPDLHCGFLLVVGVSFFAFNNCKVGFIGLKSGEWLGNILFLLLHYANSLCKNDFFNNRLNPLRKTSIYHEDLCVWNEDMKITITSLDKISGLWTWICSVFV